MTERKHIENRQHIVDKRWTGYAGENDKPGTPSSHAGRGRVKREERKKRKITGFTSLPVKMYHGGQLTHGSLQEVVDVLGLELKGERNIVQGRTRSFLPMRPSTLYSKVKVILSAGHNK